MHLGEPMREITVTPEREPIPLRKEEPDVVRIRPVQEPEKVPARKDD